jgi:hypothetical protein
LFCTGINQVPRWIRKIADVENSKNQVIAEVI